MRGTRASIGARQATTFALAAFAMVAAACQSMVAAANDGVFGVTRESGGAAMVALTPKNFADGKLTVDIQVNTHSVNDLDKYDLTKIVALDIGGKTVAPASAPKLRGHHNAGQLVFPVATLPKGFTIKIQGLDQPAERVFSWP